MGHAVRQLESVDADQELADLVLVALVRRAAVGDADDIGALLARDLLDAVLARRVGDLFDLVGDLSMSAIPASGPIPLNTVIHVQIL